MKNVEAVAALACLPLSVLRRLGCKNTKECKNADQESGSLTGASLFASLQKDER